MSRISAGGAKPNDLLKGKKIFDVARPGNTLASANSRPLIARTGPAFKDGIGDISAPESSDKAERTFTRASDPADTHKQLMGTKSRVTIQPTGMLSQDPESRSEPSTPQSSNQSSSKLVDFDLSSLYEYEHEHQDGLEEEPDALASLSIAAEESPTAEGPATEPKDTATEPEPPTKPAVKQPAWVANAEKVASTPSDDAAPPLPEGLIMAEYTPVGTNWRAVTIVSVAAIVAILVLVCIILLTVQAFKS